MDERREHENRRATGWSRRADDNQTVVTIGAGMRQVIFAAVTALVLWLVSGGWLSKESKADHDADIASIRAESRLRSATDSARWSRAEEIQQQTLDEVRAIRAGSRR